MIVLQLRTLLHLKIAGGNGWLLADGAVDIRMMW